MGETRIASDDRCLEHGAPLGYPEVAGRLESLLERLQRVGWSIDRGVSHEGAAGAVTRVHPERYVERFRAASQRADLLLDSPDNPLSAGTWSAAWAALEVALDAVDWVMSAQDRHCFAAIRPPGHHAEADLAMGFCYFNNVAVAAQYALDAHGVGRVAILDFDVHHGNGTQHLFEDRADVLYASVHQYPFYPGSGSGGERGVGPGLGRTLNVPLGAGADDLRYSVVFDEQILPAIESFAPGLLLVSAGFDAWRDDPLGGMVVTESGFQSWGHRLGALAARVCAGRLVSVLEGGYDVARLGDLVDAYLRGVSGDEGAGRVAESGGAGSPPGSPD